MTPLSFTIPAGIKARLKAASQPREIAWFFGGMVAAAVFTATAQYADTAATASASCDVNTAAQKALDDKTKMIGLTSVDPSKFFQVGGPGSCIGDFSVANLDLSQAISDPMGLLSSAATGAIDKLKSAAVSTACTVARQSMGNVIGSYNTAVNTVYGAEKAPQYMLNQEIGQMSSKAMNQAAMSWGTGMSSSSSLGLSGKTQSVISGSGTAPTTTVSGSSILQNASGGGAAASSSSGSPSTGGSVF